METELFTWNGWDIQDTSAFTFYDVTLVKPIGKYPAGTTFDFADIDYEHGTLVFSAKDGEMVNGFGKIKQVACFKIGLVIASEMPINAPTEE